ncbi:ImuA family protein [Allosphingosinicella humi]
MSESADHLTALRRRVAGTGGRDICGAGWFPLGHAGIDAMLGGGLARGRLHEAFAAEADDAASAAGFAAMLALRAMPAGSAVLWLRTDDAERRCGRFHASGFAELGGDPDALLLALAPDPVALLRGAAEAARCAGLGAVVVEGWGRLPALDLTASRRLALAAEKSGVTVLMLRIGAEPVPSAADTRWRVGAAPSDGLEANAPGHVTLDIELLRRRAGPSGLRWRLEWDRDRCAFREPALSGAVVSLPSHGSAEDPAAGALRRTA